MWKPPAGNWPVNRKSNALPLIHHATRECLSRRDALLTVVSFAVAAVLQLDHVVLLHMALYLIQRRAISTSREVLTDPVDNAEVTSLAFLIVLAVHDNVSVQCWRYHSYFGSIILCGFYATPISGWFLNRSLGLAMGNHLHIYLISYEDIKGNAKCRKGLQLWVTQDHWK